MTVSKDIYSEVGVVEISDNAGIIEQKDDVLDNKANKLLPINIKPIIDDVKPITIETYESFMEIKIAVLKANYVYLYKRDNTLCVVTDTNHYYLINTDIILKKDISTLLMLRKPKKVLFNLSDFSDFIEVSTTGILDLKLAFKVLCNIEIKDSREILTLLDLPLRSRKNIYLVGSNLINVAKEINIYVERNKKNLSLMLEQDIALESVLLEKRGVPIDLKKYNDYKLKNESSYKLLEVNKESTYGNGFDFSDTSSLFNYLQNNNMVLSLDERILVDQNKKLYEDLSIFNTQEEIKQHEIVGNNFIIRYDTYTDYQLKPYLLPSEDYLYSNGIYFIEGTFVDLYMKVFAELTKDKKIIEVASGNNFIEYFNKDILGNDKLGIHSEIFIKACCNACFETQDALFFSEKYYRTAISEKDIKFINKTFNEKAPGLMKFFLNFDGNDVIYEKYQRRIFDSSTNLDGFIKQIMNLIYKTAISYVREAVNEYNAKFKIPNEIDLEIISFYDNKIILVCSEKLIPTAIDILNRYMAASYKKLIKNTKYYNITKNLIKR